MKFNIDSKIFEQYPDFKMGLIVIKGLDNSRRVSAIESLLRGVAAQKTRGLKGKNIDDDLMIKVWNQAYGNLGINPKKIQPSVRALAKRVQDGKEIPHINSLVDLYNYFSLKFFLPIGSEDLDWLCGDLNLTFTKGEEPFRPMGSVEVEQAGEGEVAYMDDGGITCRYWNHRECERTKLTNKTTNAVIFIEDLSNMHLDEFGELLNEINTTIQKYLSAETTIHVLNEENGSVELGVQGRQNIDDSKVSAQEKAYLSAVKKKKEEHKKVKEQIQSQNNGAKPIPLEKKEQKNELMALMDEYSLKEKIRSVVEQSIVKAFSKPMRIKVNVEYPSSNEHGDYASNIAMQLGKELGTPPREIAEKLKENISKEDFIESVEIAGPGFLNFFIRKDYLDAEIDTILTEKDDYGSSKIGEDKSILIEYSSPNIAKPLGAHHLITTILGQSLANIYEKIGFNVVKSNYIGDWGTQFGKLIYAYKNWGDRKKIEADPITELLKLYVQFHDEAERDPELDDQARREFKIFEEGDKENRKIWKWIVDESLKDTQITYDLIGGIKFDNYQGESFFEDKLADTLAEGKQRGIFVEGEEGSFVVKYDDENIPPFLVQKRDGATLYSTRDFAALKYRINEWRPIKILYIVDIAQTLHFKQLFGAARRFPWYHGEGAHVWFGRMHMKDKKMSTRKGNVILLNEVLKEGVERAKKVVDEKSRDSGQKDKIANAVGIGAIKYNILSQNRTTDITFDWDRILSLDGNSAPYLQYSYARAKSILRKADDVTEDKIKDSEGVAEKIENLIRLFPKFREAITNAAQEYKPNLLGNYLYAVAQEFNAFYNAVTVIRAENLLDREYRLRIVEATSQILKNGLDLLGVEVVEEM